MCVNKLKHLGKEMSDKTKRFIFLNWLIDPEYNLVKASIDVAIAKNNVVTFESMVKLVWGHVTQVICNGKRSLQTASACCQTKSQQSSKHKRDQYNVPPMPDWLFKSMPYEVQQNVLAWMRIANRED